MDILIKLARLLIYSSIAVYSLFWTVFFIGSFLSLIAIMALNENAQQSRTVIITYLKKSIFWFLSAYFLLLTLMVLVVNVAEFKSLSSVRMRDFLFGAWNTLAMVSVIYTLIRLCIHHLLKNFRISVVKRISPDSGPAERVDYTKHGLLNKYVILNKDGTPVDQNGEYFVLRLDFNGNDRIHAEASRRAIQIYAANIYPHLAELALDIKKKYPVTVEDIPGDKAEIIILDEVSRKHGQANFVAAYVDQEGVEEIVVEAMNVYKTR